MKVYTSARDVTYYIPEIMWRDIHMEAPLDMASYSQLGARYTEHWWRYLAALLPPDQALVRARSYVRAVGARRWERRITVLLRRLQYILRCRHYYAAEHGADKLWPFRAKLQTDSTEPYIIVWLDAFTKQCVPLYRVGAALEGPIAVIPEQLRRALESATGWRIIMTRTPLPVQSRPTWGGGPVNALFVQSVQLDSVQLEEVTL